MHGFPASVPSVIVVGMSDSALRTGAERIRAPGTDVLTTFPGGRYDYASGSSLAAAHVSGVIALARALRRLDPQQMRGLLTAHEHLSAEAVLADAATLR
jgi:subtilisin family serine protease